MQLRDALRDAARRLKDAGLNTPVLDAEVLLSHVLSRSRTFLLSHPDYRLTEEEKEGYEKLIARRLRHEPVAYIVGEKEFWSRTFRVDRRVLIPRPETEVLVETALTLAQSFSVAPLKIIDVGTGSGAIGGTMAAELEQVYVLATDVSLGALEVAKENAVRLGVRGKMDFALCSGLEGISGRFHLILSNPPYVPSKDVAGLPVGVREYEPLMALNGGDSGFEMHERLVGEAVERLVKGGWLLLEIGGEESYKVCKMALDADGYEEVKVVNDYLGQARVIAMRRS